MTELSQLSLALEEFRRTLGNGHYPPVLTDDPESVKQFLAKAFPNYHGELPEKLKNLDAASSLVFWLGGMTGKDGKMIGFSADPKNPFDTTNDARIGPFYEFDLTRVRYEDGHAVYLPLGSNPQGDPFVYFRADAKGEYHGAWKNCRPCRDSINGDWMSSKTYQLFSPGMDGKYGFGVQFPSGTDYDAQRKDDMSSFTRATFADAIP